MSLALRPRRASSSLAVLVCLVASAFLLPLHARHADSNKTVFVAAVDASVNPITGTTKEDWGVREDGVNRTIVDVQPASDPIEVVLLVDTTKQIQPAQSELRNAVASFIKTVRSGKAEAHFLLGGFGGSPIMLSDFDKPASDLDRAAQRLFGSQDTSSALLDAMLDTSKRLGKRPSPRRVMLSINMEGTSENGNIAPQTVIDAVSATSASFWALSLRMPGDQAASVPSRQVVLDNLPAQTGGVHINLNTAAALVPNATRIAQILVSQYAVTYVRPDGPAPKMLQMAVARPGAQMLVPRMPPQ